MYIKYTNTRSKTSNNKITILIKKIILQIAREISSLDICITEKPVN